MTIQLSRRRFIQHTAAMGGAITLGNIWAGETPASDSETLKPIGQARGVHPGRVVWAHDPEVTNWTGPGDGHWYQGDHTRQERVDAMMVRAVCELTGDGTVSQAWDRLFLHFNRTHAKRELPYQAGEKIVIKPNWVGMIWRGRSVDPDTYTLVGNQDYMNTAPQMILALLRWPAQQGYYSIHRNSFSRATRVYREQVDLMGHSHLGSKTLLYVIDGLYPGKHSVERVPRKWELPPFLGRWASSLWASQDPVAIDSVGLDFLRAEWDDHLSLSRALLTPLCPFGRWSRRAP